MRHQIRSTLFHTYQSSVEETLLSGMSDLIDTEVEIK